MKTLHQEMFDETDQKKCERCEKIKEDVKVRADSYAREICGIEKAMHRVCDDCDLDNTMSI